MARQSTVLDVFFSCPRDVHPERTLVLETATEWNLLRSRATACYINVITSENIITPAVSDRAQSVINEQIGDDYDVYLGMMWSRLGSPTGLADSGTVEEFDRALDRFRGGEDVQLCMLFKNAPIPTSILSGEQFDKVQAFKAQYSKEGGLYREFETEDQLRAVLNRLFERIASEKEAIGTSSRQETSGELPAVVTPTGSATDDEGDSLSDLGLIDLNEQFEEVVEQQGEIMEGWTAAMVSNSKALDWASSHLETITKFGKAEPSAIKPIMSKLANNMHELSDYVESNIDLFIEKNSKIIALSEATVDIAGDFGDGSRRASVMAEVTVLIATLLDNRTSLDSLLSSMKKSPRMTTAYNRARKRAIEAQGQMRAEIERLRLNLTEILDKQRD